MVKPNEINDVAVLTHAIIVRSWARRVRSTARAVLESSLTGALMTAAPRRRLLPRAGRAG
jgi:hypothetical protein